MDAAPLETNVSLPTGSYSCAADPRTTTRAAPAAERWATPLSSKCPPSYFGRSNDRVDFRGWEVTLGPCVLLYGLCRVLGCTKAIQRKRPTHPPHRRRSRPNSLRHECSLPARSPRPSHVRVLLPPSHVPKVGLVARPPPRHAAQGAQATVVECIDRPTRTQHTHPIHTPNTHTRPRTPAPRPIHTPVHSRPPQALLPLLPLAALRCSSLRPPSRLPHSCKWASARSSSSSRLSAARSLVAVMCSVRSRSRSLTASSRRTRSRSFSVPS